MKKLYLVLFVFLLVALAISCTGTRPSSPPTYTTVTPTTPTTTVTTTTPPTTTTTSTTSTTSPTVTITPTPTITIIPEPTEKKYHVTQYITLTNDGPGTVTKMELRVALISDREPYQNVELEDIWPQGYTTTTDNYGNRFAEYVLNDIWAGQAIYVELCYDVTANDIKNDISNYQDSVPAEYTAPEPWIESDSAEIITLCNQITANIVEPSKKARAIYDWIGDNIAYTIYTARMMGALYCLQNRGGDCTEFSCLMIALCRAAGIPARFTEGVTYIASSTESPKHDWAEIYLPGNGWVPVDATWGRYEANRDRYFASMTPDHIIVTSGHPSRLGKFSNEFCYFEYKYWYGNITAHVSMDEKWEITCTSKPDTLLCTDEEYEILRAVYESWGYDFLVGYYKYSQMAFDNNWDWFWMGSDEDESRRLIFDRVGNMWQPREIPSLPP